jgi:hypothetical protein
MPAVVEGVMAMEELLALVVMAVAGMEVLGMQMEVTEL